MAWTQNGNIRGASGVPGASGPPGATGPQGPAGPTGATGASGGTGGTGGPGTTSWNDITDKPGAILNYKGTWNVSSNSPTLSDSTGSGGDVYRVSVGGSRNLGSGTISWEVGDYAIWSPVTSSWEKADTTDAVSSVAGRTGAVTLTSADLGASGSASSSTFLRGDNTWAVPSDTGITRSISTITSPTTLGASGATDYVTFCSTASDDANFADVQVLLHGEGSNNSTSIVDSSNQKYSFTRNGDTKISTAQKKYGSASILFDGTGDYLNLTNAALAPGSGDFTYEMWIYIASPSGQPIMETRSTDGNTNGFTLTTLSTTQLRLFTSSAQATTTVSNYSSTWTHVAVVKSGSTTTIYVNGTAGGTSTALSSLTSSDLIIGGGRYTGTTTVSDFFNGYIDEFRYTKGVARYTSNFTAPTAAFPDGTIGVPTLPSATSNTNRYSFRNTTGAAIIIGASGSQAINGATGGLSLAASSSAELMSNGTGWFTF